MANAPTVSQHSGVRVPVNVEELFLNTLMQFGPPPPHTEKDGGAMPRAYFYSCMRFWREQGCTGEDFGFQSFYNSKYIKWLNHNHETVNAKRS
jgi:hypothetical protein